MKAKKFFQKGNGKYFDFHSTKSVKNTFERLDEKYNLQKFEISSMLLYFNIYKELLKRKTKMRQGEYDEIFMQNLEIYSEFIKTFYFSPQIKLNELADFNASNYYLKNTNKKLKVQELGKMKLIGFNSLDTKQRFEYIFDKIILDNNNFDVKRYKEYFQNNRYCVNIENVDYFSEKDIKNIKRENKAKSILKHHKIKKINLYVVDLSKDEFKYLYSIISELFADKKIKVIMKREFKEYSSSNKYNLDIFLCYENININQNLWTTNNRYVVSYKNLEKDLWYLFSKMAITILKKLKITEFENLSFEEKRQIYNNKYYTAKQIKKFIFNFKGREDSDFK